MQIFLLITGGFLALVGLGAIAAGAPDWVLGLSLGATLIQSGTIALVGGLVLVGLGLVLNALQEVLRRLESAPPASARAAIMPPEERPAAAPRQAQPQVAPPARPAAPAEAQPRAREREAPPAYEPAEPQGRHEEEIPRVRRERREPVPEPAADEFADARPRRERVREAYPEEAPRARRPAPAQQPGEEPRPRRAAPSAEYMEEPQPQPRLRPRPAEIAHDEPARPRGERPRATQPDEAALARDFSQIPPIPQPFGNDERRRPSETPPEPEPYIPKFRPSEPAPQRSAAEETVVRSGVIGGMAYTLYADGSIEAELPIGTVRFNSIAELQDHVLRTGTEADADFDEQTR